MTRALVILAKKQVKQYLESGHGNEELRYDLGQLYTSDVLDEAISEYLQDKDNVYTLEDPRAIIAWEKNDKGYQWYAGPGPDSVRWNHTKSNLEKKNLLGEAVEYIDRSSTRVLSLSPNPYRKVFSGRGLVLGYVQSGKTTNFISVLSKAADEGYRLVIILSGITNNLRDQTQKRVEDTLRSEDDHSWNWLTLPDSDSIKSHNAKNLLSQSGIRLIGVFKKNSTRLEAIQSWLKSAGGVYRAIAPMLIIDDEADQASVNSHKIDGRQTRINELITDLLDPKFMPRTAYVGYTATPFANILGDATDPNQIFPRDFIVSLEKSKGYFGAEELFGRDPIDEEDQEIQKGRDIIRNIPNKELPTLQTAIMSNQTRYSTPLSKSLEDAIIWFFLSTAARRKRTGENQFATMMVHTSGRVTDHQTMKNAISNVIAEWNRENESQNENRMKTLWDFEKSIGWKTGDEPILPWADIRDLAFQMMRDVRVIEDNYKSTDRLFYDFENEDTARPVIVVGGNTLSRGLTLEGLSSTFFLRKGATYDTLLQMGRWFGYRPRYEDLQRIWMHDDIIPYFRDLALVEEEIREQIRNFGDEVRPDQVPIKIRTHNRLAITSRLKMLHAVKVQLGLAKSRIETIIFPSEDSWLKGNIDATSRFIDKIQSSDTPFTVSDRTPFKYPVAERVPWTILKEYLLDYKWLKDAKVANVNLIVDYVEKIQRASSGELADWNIFAYNLLSEDQKVFLDSRKSVNFSLINRSAKKIYEDGSINLHHLVSQQDQAADLEIERKKLAKLLRNPPKDSGTSEIIRKLRAAQGLGGVGLLGIYLVNGKSPKSGDRYPLDLSENIVGLGFFFPESSVDSSIADYFGPRLPDFESDNEEDYQSIVEADNDDELQSSASNG